ncbi:hypothetical protein CLAFUW4_06358 [Fulvia fulva]|uniref:Uncharacterized protein n=1 Tax=Passalora fulva TaxID=5499 RepID=A0A9Q8LIG7_PASFU|nr:uncharacterized protein CLAFUR5_06502 [Fulvia fulva]KAK4623621.1 hypothetical protein CLAFUR4_06361 [Fulvia fulva]KAK4625842.1 hypothetical protein CLAFUR0_06363 [Fulvia fulva]UJO17739.1 hypothetical protein CLAFUR5_06502 [Fulvia fulva]WPV15190.1 hypothetical protein CLAFUW4_06358 [Fulvia fulva]WPV29657.1 hypothetical protein CLAFUW7_06356 [Fulvia fulva]
MTLLPTRCNSARTLATWHNVAKPADLLVLLLIGSTATLIATIVVNAVTSANAPDNDYSPDTGWATMMPVPTWGFLWTLLDIFICRFWVLNPIYALVMTTLLFCGYIVTGTLTAMFFEWATDGAWVPAVFFFIMAVLHAVYLRYAARAVHVGKKRTKADDFVARFDEP